MESPRESGHALFQVGQARWPFIGQFQDDAIDFADPHAMAINQLIIEHIAHNHFSLPSPSDNLQRNGDNCQ
jgi:hypothetical protein